ncbi:MAG: lipid A deacylase LpxR family protein [Chitinophagaceae bacterium]
MHLPCFLAAAPFLTMHAMAQNNTVPRTRNIFQNEISLVTENDNYTLRGRDGYYTNGIYLKFIHAVNTKKISCFKNRPAIEKVVNGFELGQAIYNPVSYNRPIPSVQDRPFAGYLSFKFDQHIFYNKHTVLEWAATLGTIGPNSFGKNVQRWYHNVIGIYDVKGWPYQVKNEMSVNLKTAYYRSLLKSDPVKNIINIDGFAIGNLGNAFTNLSAGVTFKLGLVENHNNSSHFGARVAAPVGSKQVRNYELYFEYEPSATWQLYSAVLQGGLFIKDKGPVIVPIKALVYSNRLGIHYAQNTTTVSVVYTNRTRQATTQQRNENFCSIQFAHRFSKLK